MSLTAFFCWLLATPWRVLADEWQASLYSEGLPSHLVAVDKQRQTFMFFEKKSPLKLKFSYACTTGQAPGDKQALNDLRTPEGVYFVEYKIAGNLDFREYGGIAYTLNYPNPVDRLRGKTGHGIWIHSKGFGIEPFSTRGCVAIGLREIDEVGPSLVPGTAVVLAEKMDEKALLRPDNATARHLRRRMQAWSEAWAARSEKMFDFYDAEAYSRAMPESFAAFRLSKERLFKLLSFVKIYNRKIHALEGPGYWVTWSEQFYTASNLSTEGVRRLYWQQGRDRQFRIVGMEWTPRDLGMRADFQKGRLLAEAPLQTTSDAAFEAPQPPPLTMPEYAPETALPQNAGDRTAPAATERALPGETLLAVSDPLVPRAAPASQPAEVNWGAVPTMESRALEAVGLPEAVDVPEAVDAPDAADAFDARPGAGERSAKPALPERNCIDQNPRGHEALSGPAAPQALRPDQPRPAAPEAAPQQPPAEDPQRAAPLSPQPLSLNPEERAALEEAVQGWNKALAARSPALADYYDQARYNREPGAPGGASYQTMWRHTERRLRAPWLRVISRKPVIEARGALAVSSSQQMLAGPEGMVQGVNTLWWRKDQEGRFRIVASQFRPEELGLAADYLDEVSAAVSVMLEDWRKAWEAGRLDEYMDFYAATAVQQGRGGAVNIRRRKQTLWTQTRPSQVRISGLRLTLDRQGVRADMHQVYTDSAGHTDQGTKTLLLRYDGRGWRIVREDWRALPG